MKLARVALPLVLAAALAGCGTPSEEEAVPTVTETVTATPTSTPSAIPTPSPTPTPSEPAPTSSVVDRTAEVQAVAGAGVTRAEQDETGRFTIWTAIVDPRGDDGSPEAQAAIAICNAVQQTFGATSISVYEADESTFVVYGHPVYGPNSCAEV